MNKTVEYVEVHKEYGEYIPLAGDTVPTTLYIPINIYSDDLICDDDCIYVLKVTQPEELYTFKETELLFCKKKQPILDYIKNIFTNIVKYNMEELIANLNENYDFYKNGIITESRYENKKRLLMNMKKCRGVYSMEDNHLKFSFNQYCFLEIVVIKKNMKKRELEFELMDDGKVVWL